ALCAGERCSHPAAARFQAEADPPSTPSKAQVVDGGGVRKRLPAPVEASDTASSPGSKSDALAVQCAAASIDELADGRQTQASQGPRQAAVFFAPLAVSRRRFHRSGE